ncbi:DUF418 domain-containing protein [Ureibacillus sinduriensis]|uniref:DUF418 domain-containing protein n=1 Tax=Ureibacillus sinduriensis BLB-1 = JCM 15800 TaxID=1384057 RepID=A0A0A3HRD0_9BACL|nr:DUF418 domain-containing protein [Ureibacillus sinduriensis]KGR75166.1 hypothetical protein CD33_12910 [Ureibacillus sinduriensis BLB-1 = JCM 15800]
MKPIENNERVEVLDVLRGFALFGILFLNIPAVLNVELPSSVGDTKYFYFLQLVFEGKFFTIFTFLFGVGFSIFMTRAQAKGERAYILFAKRLAILLIFGLIHMQFHPGEALFIYAIIGFILMVTMKFPKQLNLLLGLVLLVIVELLGAKILMPLPLILLGIAAGQYGLFYKIEANKRKWTIAAILFFIGAAIAILYGYLHLPSTHYFIQENSQSEIDKILFLYDMTLYTAPLISGFFVTLIVCLVQWKGMRRMLSPLKFFGRMALTNYIGQTVLMLFIGKVLLDNATLTYTQTGWMTLGINLALIVISTLWLQRFTYGPLEKLWRMGTYSKFK